MPDAVAEAKQTATLSQSAMVEILNPKTAIFYVAFLPQFTDEAAFFVIWIQLLVLGTVVKQIAPRTGLAEAF